MTEREEEAYIRGGRMAWRLMLGECLKHLDVDDPEAARAAWVLEREAVAAALRRACADHGDNDWPNDLHLADVIEKHLVPYLPDPTERPEERD